MVLCKGMNVLYSLTFLSFLLVEKVNHSTFSCHELSYDMVQNKMHGRLAKFKLIFF